MTSFMYFFNWEKYDMAINISPFVLIHFDRSHTSSVYSHRTLSRQTYFQPKGVQINAAGLPSERDGSLPTESQVYMKLLQEQRLHIV